MGQHLERLHQLILKRDKTDYFREQYQSFMTGPEWRNVEMAEEYAAFLGENQSMFRFPYFKQVFDLWRVFYNSYRAARRYNSASSIIFSEYMLMDLFVSAFTTMELIPKGMFSLLLYPFLNKKNDTTFQMDVAKYYANYAANLQTIPFYDQDYKTARRKLSEAYRNAPTKTWGDWFTHKFVSIELWARHWISKPLSYWYHSENNIVPPTTDVLVKFRSNTKDNEAASAEFLSKIAHDKVKLKECFVKEHAKKNINIYARLQMPRYADFQPAIRTLANNGVHLQKIAGQDHVQVKCVVSDLNDVTPVATPLYSYGDRIHANRHVCLFDVPVKKLTTTLQEFDKCPNTTVKFIHNF